MTDRLCKNCEYFDGGGRDKEGNWKLEDGDCLNRLAPRFQTKQEDTCLNFFADTSQDDLSGGSAS